MTKKRNEKKNADAVDGGTVEQKMESAQVPTSTSDCVGWISYWGLKDCRGDRSEFFENLKGISEHDLFPERLGYEERMRHVKSEVTRPYRGLLSIDVLERIKNRIPKTDAELAREKAGETIEERFDEFTIYQPTLRKKGKVKKEFQGSVAAIKSEAKARIALNTSDGTISLEDGGDISKALKEAFEGADGQFLHQEVQAFLRKFVASMKGLPLKGHGGVYWVPFSEENERRCEAMKKLIGSIGQSSFRANKIYGGDWAATAGDAAEVAVSSPLSKIVEEVNQYISTMDSGDLVQPRSLAEKVKQCKRLLEKMDLYREVLSDRSEGMQNAMGILRELAKDIMDGSAEVRVLQRTAKKANSEDLNTIAEKKVKALAKSSREKLEQALSHYSPEIPEDE